MVAPGEEKQSLIDEHEIQDGEISTKQPRKYFGFTRREWTLSILIVSLILFKILLFKVLFLDNKLQTGSSDGQLGFHGEDNGPWDGGVNATEMHWGDLTYYAPGLGSCGLWNTQDDYICAISHELYDSLFTPNPNNNPFCKRRIRASRNKAGVGWVSVDVTVVDRCEGCKYWDLDFSPAAFQVLADPNLGRVDVQWEFLD